MIRHSFILVDQCFDLTKKYVAVRNIIVFFVLPFDYKRIILEIINQDKGCQPGKK